MPYTNASNRCRFEGPEVLVWCDHQQTYFTLWFRSGQWRVWVHVWEEEAWAHRSSDSKRAQMLRPKYGSADQKNRSHGLFLEDLFDADWSPQQSGSPLTHYNQNSRRSDQSANIKLGLLEGSQSIKMKCYCGPPRHYRDTTPNRKSHRPSNPLQHQRSRHENEVTAEERRLQRSYLQLAASGVVSRRKR